MKPAELEVLTERPLPATPPPSREARPRLKTSVRAGLLPTASVSNANKIWQDDWLAPV
jgi:hypothetical protein